MPRRETGNDRPIALAAIAVAVLAVAFVAPSGADTRLDLEKLEDGYISALNLLAKGEREQALDLLVATEVEALGDSPNVNRVDRVWRHKLGVVRRALELTSHEVLVPVIVLHHDAHDRYREMGQPILARHARDMAVDLAIYKVQTSGADADRRFAGWVLASLGASLLDLRTARTSAAIFQNALNQAPDNPVALLGLAWAHEIRGEYEAAGKLLRRLLDHDPTSEHARLRLAVCERRLDNLDSARRLLVELLGTATVGWVRSIGYQELARVYISRSDLDAAAAAAEKGLEEFPGEQELSILLASISERRGRSKRAREVISDVKPQREGAESSRYIYDSRPDLGIDEARATLRQMQDDRLELLASGLRWWGAAPEPTPAAGGQG